MHPANKWLVGILPVALVSGAALWEGKRNDPYYDLAKVLTVCYGHTGSDIQQRKYSDVECMNLLKKDLLKHSVPVLECINQPLTTYQYSAFVLMAYNVGTSGFCSSKTAKTFNQGHSEAACKLIAYGPNGRPNWSYVNGEFIQGLHNRRIFEMKICLGEKGDFSIIN